MSFAVWKVLQEALGSTPVVAVVELFGATVCEERSMRTLISYIPPPVMSQSVDH